MIILAEQRIHLELQMKIVRIIIYLINYIFIFY